MTNRSRYPVYEHPSMDSRAHSFYREYLMNECALNELNEECHFVSQFEDAKNLGYIMNMSEIFVTLNEASKRVKSMNDEELKIVLERGKALKVGSSSDTLGACYILIKYCEDILFLKIFKDLILKFKKAIDEDETKECYSLYVIGCHLVTENNLHHHSIRLLKDQVSEEEFDKSPSKDKCLRCIIKECEQRYEFKKKRAITMFYYILRKRNLT